MNPVKADKLFVNGHILPQDGSPHECSQIATQGNRIIGIGNDLDHLKEASTEVFDLKGNVVLPGFIDAHVHFIWGGESLLSIPGNQATSKSGFIELIKNYARGREPGSWLRGGGWNEHLFEQALLPHKSWLDEAAPGHPMILTRHDGHSGIASSTALEIAGISRDTPDPEGGVIDRDGNGEPTGILRDAAMGLLMSHMPQESEIELRHNLDAAQAYLLERGVTAIGDMIHDMDHFIFLQQMAREDQLKVRISAYLPIQKWPEIKGYLEEGIFENEWFQFKGLKGFCDGSLGSHTALMLEPYADTPDASGIYDTDWSDIEIVKAYISEADKMGFQTVVHAIGDRAVREVLDIYEEVIKSNGPRDRRFRVEHAQHIHPDDQTRFKALDVIASVQPAHCVDDSLYAEDLLGDRCSYAYPFAALLDQGSQLALGSDWPVSPADPVATIHGAIHRAGWHREQAMTLQQSLQTHTQGAAFAGFRDHDLGSLKSGYLADFVILDPEVLRLDVQDVQTGPLLQAVVSNGDILSANQTPTLDD